MHFIILSLLACNVWAGPVIQQNGVPMNLSVQTVSGSTITVTNVAGTPLAPSSALAPVHIRMNGSTGYAPINPTQVVLLAENGTNNGTTSFECMQKGLGICVFNFNMNGTADDGIFQYDVTGAADRFAMKISGTETCAVTSTGIHCGGAGNPVGPADFEGTTQGVGIPVLTQVQVRASTPARAGQIIYNSNTSSVCVSTATTIMAYARIDGAAAACGQ